MIVSFIRKTKEAEMIIDKVLHIEYPTGEMNIIIDKFFPTTVKRADKVFHLVKEHEPLDALILYHHLEALAHHYFEEIDKLSDEIDSAINDEAYQDAYAGHRYALRKYDQAKRNMRDLKKIAKLEV